MATINRMKLMEQAWGMHRRARALSTPGPPSTARKRSKDDIEERVIRYRKFRDHQGGSMPSVPDLWREMPGEKPAPDEGERPHDEDALGDGAFCEMLAADQERLEARATAIEQSFAMQFGTDITNFHLVEMVLSPRALRDARELVSEYNDLMDEIRAGVSYLVRLCGPDGLGGSGSGLRTEPW